MNYLKLELKLWQHFWAKRKKVATQRHATRIFNKTLDEALELFRQQPRKYYIVKKSDVEWEILGSQELKKLRKFKAVKEDQNFMKLEELAFVVSSDNFKRLVHERRRDIWYIQWWNHFTRNYYKPVSDFDLTVFEKMVDDLSDPDLKKHLASFINRHK